jgi:hypothetical protein
MTDPKDPSETADETATDPETATDHETLSGFNASEIVDDPDDLAPEDPEPPAATPDSPNPI